MKPTYYQVNPRYSPGSPAMVPENIALEVKTNEMEGYKNCLEGVYGEDHKQYATKMGLGGIVLKYFEKNGKLCFLDMITGRRFQRFDTKGLMINDKIIRGPLDCVGTVVKVNYPFNDSIDPTAIIKTDTAEVIVMVGIKRNSKFYVERDGGWYDREMPC